MQQCQRIVCYRLGYTAQQYIEHMHACMLRYLELKPGLAHYPDVRLLLAGHPLFARWWKNQWLHRELKWVNAIERGDTYEKLAESYAWSHNPRVLAGGIHPYSVYMEHSFAEIIGKIQKA